MRKTHRVQAGGRLSSIVLVAVLASSLVTYFAAPALAISLSISPKSGNPGTRVTVNIGGLSSPCTVTFDSTLVVPPSGCVPDAGGNVTAAFNVPAAAGAGQAHSVVATTSESGGSTSVSVGFTVGSPPAPPAPPPAPKPPAPAPKPPAPAPAPPAPAPAPTPTRAATPTPAPTPTPSDSPTPSAAQTPTPGVSPTAGAGCELQPSDVESFSIDPTSGAAGSTATVSIDWAPNADSGCEDAPQAQVRVNGDTASDPVAVGGSQTTMEVDIPEDLSDGDINVALVSVGTGGQGLATTTFTVEGSDDDEVSSWLLVVAGVVASLVALVGARLYGRRKARYGRR